MIDSPITTDDIVITAARTVEDEQRTAASVLVLNGARIDRLAEPLVPALLRLTPSAAIAVSGPAGSLTEVRIRGSEANHSLLFVDGIRLNDPAAGNQPRFELLNADLVSRIEVVRGPQSALWGSEAIGGVIAVNGLAGARRGASATVEGGSSGFRRTAFGFGHAQDAASLDVALAAQSANGIDAFDGTGDLDGYRNRSARVRADWSPTPALSLGATAIGLSGRSQFDGYDPMTFRRSDTLDSSRNRLGAVRAWARFDPARGGWKGQLAASALGSSNRNFLDRQPVNSTRGSRVTAEAQAEKTFSTGSLAHAVVLAAAHERESFRSRDTAYGGLSDQDRHRDHQSLTAQWRTERGRFVGDVALRRDSFSAFVDATTVRASLLAGIGSGVSLAASYGEGIAQPTFFDLYGFFPGNFQGNPKLVAESSRGFEASIRFRRGPGELAATVFRQRLDDEIVDVFDPVTFAASTANRSDSSYRRGIEIEGALALGRGFSLSGHYAYLDASEPGLFDDSRQRELRRPRHSGAIIADGSVGAFEYGLTFACSGARTDTDFDSFPARRVRLGAFCLGGARAAYSLGRAVQLFARASNLFDARYEEVFANRTEGRALYAGIRLRDRR